MNLSGLFKSPRVIEGHGFLITRYPSLTLFPESSKTSASKPGIWQPTVQGFSGMTGSTLSMAPPISVPPDRLITGHLLLPTFSKYHCHASEFMGSPVAASIRRDEKSCFSTCTLFFINDLMAV